MTEDTARLALSVVIASHDAARAIGLCLSALLKQRRLIEEVIVADSSTDGTEAVVRERFPNVRLLHFDAPLTLPQLRASGIATTCGDIIAILDPYSIVDDRWAEQVIHQHQARTNTVIGGTVELYEAEKQNLWTWSQYINEYGMFMSPNKEGASGILPGSNISYKRSALFADGAFKHDDFWKTFANEEIQTHSELWLAPQIVVHLYKPIPFGDFLRTRFHHGRCYAGMRVAGGSRRARGPRAISTPALPFVLLLRWGRNYWPKKRRRREFVLTLPLQLLLFGSWALGEFFGYARGAADSCRRLFY